MGTLRQQVTAFVASALENGAGHTILAREETQEVG